MTISGNLHSQLQLSYRLGVLRDGKLVHETALRPHMLTDAGLDRIGSYTALQQLYACILGTAPSPTPIRRDDGAVTFTQAGSVITASSAFFVAADVGRLFKWGVGSAGAETYITAFVSSTAVEVGNTATVAAPTAGTVWYVNTAVLVQPIAGLSWSKQPTGNGSVAAVVGDTCTVTHTTVNVSSALAAPATVTELAIATNTTNAAVFDRDVISPPVALLAGDQAVVTIEYVARYSPVTPVAVGNVATGYDSTGSLQIEALGIGNMGGIAAFDVNGTVLNSDYPRLEPHFAGDVGVRISDFALQSFSTGAGPQDGAAGVKQTLVNAAYGSGTHYRDSTTTFAITEANGPIYGVSLYTGGYNVRGVTLKFAAPFTKLNTQTLSFTFRKSWSRVLTN